MTSHQAVQSLLQRAPESTAAGDISRAGLSQSSLKEGRQAKGCLPPQTPFSPSPISDRNTRGKMNSMASMTCSRTPCYNLALARQRLQQRSSAARQVADMVPRTCTVQQDIAS